MSREVRCKSTHSHASFDRNEGKCSSCGSGLEAACTFCGDYKSYGHVKSHENRCTKKHPEKEDEGREEEEEEEEEEREIVTFAYWASSWKLNSNKNAGSPFATPPKGQFWDGLPKGVSKKHGFRVHKIQDPTMKGMEWMDSYDAVFATLACDPCFKLARVYHSWEEVVDVALEDPKKSLKNVDVLVLGNWIHEVTKDDDDDLTVPLQWLERLRMVEVESGCRIFPPLDYSMAFARKELLIRLLEQCVQPPGFVIPTVCAIPGQDRFEAIASFGKVDMLVCKRSISESKRHVQFVKTKDWLNGSKRNKQKSSANSSSIPWIVQPFRKEFGLSNELRLYIVDGKFLWGVASKFHGVEGSDISLFPFAPGRIDGDWDAEAVQVAERLVAAIAKRRVDASRFLRIDMVRSSEQEGWLINEVEFFGNAFLHFEVMDDAYEIFPTLVQAVKNWIYVENTKR